MPLECEDTNIRVVEGNRQEVEETSGKLERNLGKRSTDKTHLFEAEARYRFEVQFDRFTNISERFLAGFTLRPTAL